MKKLLWVLSVLFLANCSVTQPYVSSIAPAGNQGLLVEKCKVQFNSLTSALSDKDCQTSYVYIGAGSGAKADEGSNPNNNVITIK